MATRYARIRPTTVILTAIALILAIGWTSREMAHARDRAAVMESQTINVDKVKMSVFKDGDNPVGQIGLYVQGESPGCSSLVTGRFVIDPGKSASCPSRACRRGSPHRRVRTWRDHL